MFNLKGNEALYLEKIISETNRSKILQLYLGAQIGLLIEAEADQLNNQNSNWISNEEPSLP